MTRTRSRHADRSKLPSTKKNHSNVSFEFAIAVPGGAIRGTPKENPLRRAVRYALIDIAHRWKNTPGILRLKSTGRFVGASIPETEIDLLLARLETRLQALGLHGPVTDTIFERNQPEVGHIRVWAHFRPLDDQETPDEALVSEVAKPFPVLHTPEGMTKPRSDGLSVPDKQMQALFKNQPDDPFKRLEAVVSINRKFRTAVKDELQPVVDSLLRKFAPGQYSANQYVAGEINAALRETGTAIVHPDTGLPSTVVADRNRLVIQQKKTADDGTRPRSKPTTQLDAPISLTEAIREEKFVDLSKRANQPRSRSK